MAPNIVLTGKETLMAMTDIQADTYGIFARCSVIGADSRLCLAHIADHIKLDFGTDKNNLCVWLEDTGMTYAPDFPYGSSTSYDNVRGLRLGLSIPCTTAQLISPVLLMSWEELGIPRTEMPLPLDKVCEAAERASSWRASIESASWSFQPDEKAPPVDSSVATYIGRAVTQPEAQHDSTQRPTPGLRSGSASATSIVFTSDEPAHHVTAPRTPEPPILTIPADFVGGTELVLKAPGVVCVASSFRVDNASIRTTIRTLKDTHAPKDVAYVQPPPSDRLTIWLTDNDGHMVMPHLGDGDERAKEISFPYYPEANNSFTVTMSWTELGIEPVSAELPAKALHDAAQRSLCWPPEPDNE